MAPERQDGHGNAVGGPDQESGGLKHWDLWLLLKYLNSSLGSWALDL